LEVIAGFIFIVLRNHLLTDFVRFITRAELIEDPTDFIANHFVSYADKISLSIQIFFALYLIINGIIKILLAYGLLRNKIWVYPVAMIMYGLLLIYEIFRHIIHPTYWLSILIVFEVIFLLMITYKFNKLVHKS
jgi:uncharacterized membrane protein